MLYIHTYVQPNIYTVHHENTLYCQMTWPAWRERAYFISPLPHTHNPRDAEGLHFTWGRCSYDIIPPPPHTGDKRSPPPHIHPSWWRTENNSQSQPCYLNTISSSDAVLGKGGLNIFSRHRRKGLFYSLQKLLLVDFFLIRFATKTI